MTRTRIIAIVVTVIVVVAVFVFILPRIADYRGVLSTLGDLTWREWLALAGATILNIVTFAPPYMVTLPGIGFVRALAVTQASTASTYLAPGGAAVGTAVSFAMLRGWGFSTQAVALSVTLVSVWNQLFLFAAPAIAVLLLGFTGASSTTLRTVALVGIAVFLIGAGLFAAALSGDSFARRIGNLAARVVNWALRLIRRGEVTWTGESLVAFRRRAVGLLRTRWWSLTLATLAGQLSVFLVLFVCLRSLGVSSDQVTLAEAFASWTLVRLLGSLPITPGGIGVVELGLTGALVGFGGNNEGVVAAVLLYRALTIFPTLVLGLVAGASWRRLKPRQDAAAA